MLNVILKSKKLILFVLLFSMLFSFVNVNVAKAVSQYPFDDVAISEDLKSIKDFDFSTYATPNDDSDVSILNVVEWAYSVKANKQNDFALYVYIYNPKRVRIETNSSRNTVLMAVKYNDVEKGITDESTPSGYEKFNLKYCSKTTGTYENLFYKFRVVDHVSTHDDKNICRRVNSEKRRYDIAGIELLLTGKENPVDYRTGGTYYFTGFSQGYGANENSKSTLSSAGVLEMDTVSLELYPTFYRPETVSNLGVGHYNELNSVVFSVPEWCIKKYGDITAENSGLISVKAEWYEYKTQPIWVVDDAECYTELKDFLGYRADRYTPDLMYWQYYFDYVRNEQSGHGSFSGSYNTDQPSLTTLRYLFSVPSGVSAEDFVIDTEDLKNYIYNFEKSNAYDAWKLASQTADVKQTYKWLTDSTTRTGTEWEKVDDADKYLIERGIDPSLFTHDVDTGATRGKNTVEIMGTDVFKMDSYMSSHTWLDVLFDDSVWGKNISGDIQASGIYQLQESDFYSSGIKINDDAVSKGVYVNPGDVSDIRAKFDLATKENGATYLLRYASRDYYVSGLHCGSGLESSREIGYSAVETVFLDFDVIELTFAKQGVYHVIPVVANPIDVINDVTSQNTAPQWWERVVAWLLFAGAIIAGIFLLKYMIKALDYSMGLTTTWLKVTVIIVVCLIIGAIIFVLAKWAIPWIIKTIESFGGLL